MINLLGIKIKLKTKSSIKNKNQQINYECYNNNYYKEEDNKLKFSSAKHIIDIIQKYYKPKSVIDFGCGNGIFLKSWQSLTLEVDLS